MNENKIIETLKYISQFVENRHDEGLGDYLHIVIGRTDINVIDETIYLLERKQKEIVRYKKEIKNQQKEIEEKTTIIMAGAEKVKQLEKEIEVLTLDLEEMTKTYNHMKENWVHKLALNSYIRKDKIRETFQFYIERDSLFNDNPHKMAVIRLKDVLKELLEEK
jgi:predicted RNase H-like nuclease (RuvC/YqgF family)